MAAREARLLPLYVYKIGREFANNNEEGCYTPWHELQCGPDKATELQAQLAGGPNFDERSESACK
jgi:hypothetical protein